MLLKKYSIQIKQILQIPFYGIKLRKPARPRTTYDEEKQEQKKLEKEFRKKLTADFWTEQTIVENNYIEKFIQEELETKKREDQKFRDSIIKIAYQTNKRVEKLKKSSELEESIQRKYLLEKDLKAMNRQRILQILQHESKNWINLQNFNKLDQETLIPSTVFNETEYYLKLHEQAFLYEQGRFKELEEITLQQPEIQYKNSLIMPIYQEIVSMVKHLKNTESNKLEKEYQVAKKLLKDDLIDHQTENLIQEKMEKLDKAFQTLRAELKKKQDKPESQIEFLHQHLLLLYNLLRKWSNYTSIIKTPNSAIRVLITRKQRGSLKGEQIIKRRDMEEEDSFYGLQEQENEFEKEQDNIQSNDEKPTSDSEDEIDIKKFVEEEKQREETIKKQKEEFMKKMEDQQKEKQKQKEVNKDEIETILDQEQIIQNLIQQFEQTADDQLQSQYPVDPKSSINEHKDKADQKEFFKKLDIENIFPRALIDNALQFDQVKHLEIQNVQQALKIEERIDLIKGEDPNQSPRKFETSLIVEVFKERSNALRQQGISRAYQQKLNDIDTLLDLIGEIRVEESEFLLRVWNNY